MLWFSSANQDFAYLQVLLWWSVFVDVDQLILDYQQQGLQKEAAFTLWFLCVFFSFLWPRNHIAVIFNPPPPPPLSNFCVLLLLWQLLCVGFFLHRANTVK